MEKIGEMGMHRGSNPLSPLDPVGSSVGGRSLLNEVM